MATITTDTYLDGGVARTAGEVWTINGGILTIRTDSRWHANAPASMTGTFSDLVISTTLGGGVLIDAQNVRWVAYDAGGGNVPAIGTTITGGTSGATGYLLGVWSAINAAPTAVGAAMPTTGFLKLREMTGAFVDNDVLSGITATTNGVDQLGWIEVVMDQAAGTDITVPRLGFFRTRGGWFELGTTTGSANQIVQLPTNGSTTTYGTGLWIETAPSSGEYEFYPSIYAAGMTTANLGTDARSKFVCMETNGGMRIGHNGTTSVGYVPASGCKIRVPNIFLRQATTAARATNVIPNTTLATRPEFGTTAAGVIDIEYASIDWYCNFAQASSVTIKHTAVFEIINISECATAITLEDTHTAISGSYDSRTLQLTSNFAGGTLTDCKFQRFQAGSNDHSIEIIYCQGLTLENVHSGIVTFARSTGVAFQITQSSNITLNECKGFNQGIIVTTSSNITINDYDHCDRYVGTTNTTGINAINIASTSSNVVINGMTFGLGGSISNVHPYLALLSCGQSSNITLRNIGTRSSFLSGGSANNPQYIFSSTGNNSNVRVQRCYVAPLRTSTLNTINSDKGNTYEHVYGDFADTALIADLNTTCRNIGNTNTTTGQTSVYGTHFSDYFTSNTVGRILLHFNEPTAETVSTTSQSLSSTSGFTSAGGLALKTSGDYFTVETPYFIKGHTGFSATTPTYTGTNATTNHSFVYQIDTGSGYGAETSLTGANLALESITPSTGFKIRIKSTCTTTSTTNLLTYIRLDTTSTLAAQTDNLYPLDTVTLTLTGLITGSDIVILSAGTETELVNVDANGGTTYNFIYETPEAVDIGVFKAGYIPFYIRNYSLSSSNASVIIAQVADRNYTP